MLWSSWLRCPKRRWRRRGMYAHPARRFERGRRCLLRIHGEMAVEKWGVMERECDAGREEAMGWACGCRDYSGEECRAVLCFCEPVVVIVSGFAEGVVVARNMSWNYLR